LSSLFFRDSQITLDNDFTRLHLDSIRFAMGRQRYLTLSLSLPLLPLRVYHSNSIPPPPSRSPCLRSSDYFSDIVLSDLFNLWDILDVDADADVDVDIVLFCCVMMILCERFRLLIDNNNNDNTV